MLKKDEIRKLFMASQAIRTRLFNLTHVTKPAGSRILVIAPHPDDESLGCGGTLLLHHQLGHQVRVVFLTDGERGIKKVPAREVRDIRRTEAVAAAAALHIPEDHLDFLALPDGKVSQHAGTSYELRAILERFDPDTIYLPSFLESHPDHYAANVLLKNNLIGEVRIGAYEVWTTFQPNILVDISGIIDVKRHVIEQYSSQIRELNYLEAITCLNRYRAAMYGAGLQYAEAFITCTSTQYFELMRSTE